jgi:hypothetical protein
LPVGGRFPIRLGWAALIGGIGTVAGGIAQAYTGLSPLAMMIGMPANILLLLWAIGLGGFLWRLSLEGSGRDGLAQKV